MTCPVVAKIYRIMEKNTSDETFTILIGTATHPEVVGIAAIFGAIFAFLRIFPNCKKPSKVTLHNGLVQNNSF